MDRLCEGPLILRNKRCLAGVYRFVNCNEAHAKYVNPEVVHLYIARATLHFTVYKPMFISYINILKKIGFNLDMRFIQDVFGNITAKEKYGSMSPYGVPSCYPVGRLSQLTPTGSI